MTDWRVERIDGSPDEVFTGQRSSAALLSAGHIEPTIRLVNVDAPVLVLGSGQDRSIVGNVARTVTRRSGGGAVWLDPAEQVWVDVLVPAGHPCWHDDVTESFQWIGLAWKRAVESLGQTDDLSVHSGRLVSTPWSSLLCFAGRGPGEVFVGRRKLVGIAQRRSRAGSLFQCGLLLHWTFDPAWFATDRSPAEDPDVHRAGVGLHDLGVEVDHGAVVAAFVSSVRSLTAQLAT